MAHVNDMLDYLADLVKNNNREWYHANKEWYKKANAVFERMLCELIMAIGEFDDGVAAHMPKDLTFKMMRDIRFSRDKSPYKPAFRAHISSSGKLPIPVGYYVYISPGNHSFLGGGLFASMFKDATAMVRDYIVDNGDELDAVVHNKQFANLFAVKGESLKNVPKGYDPAHPQIKYIKHKSWYLEYPVSDTQISDSSEFIRHAARIFRCMKPFNDYLNSALRGFAMPPR